MVTDGYRVKNGDMLVAPIPNASTVGVPAKLQQAAQPVLLLYRLQKEDVPAEFSNRFVKLRICFKKLAGIYGRDIRMRSR